MHTLIIVPDMRFTNAPIVSIIIPCYNHGIYLSEALESIENCSYKNICEVIIIDDGSTDPYTIEKMASLKETGWNIITQKNKGLGAARNTGVIHATGKYILPLDADNKLTDGYLKNYTFMEANPEIAVVYGNARYFGEQTGIWQNTAWSLQKLMLYNYIDACALIKKEALTGVGNYSEDLVYNGYEDWDLWLKLAFAGYKFKYIDEICFEYRIVKSSMVRSLTKEKANRLLEQIDSKHKPYLDAEALNDYMVKQNPLTLFFKLCIKKYLPSFYNYLYKKNLVRKYF